MHDTTPGSGLPVAFLSVPVHLLALPLQYDNRADDLTKEGMLKGIEQAAAFILFLSPGVLERPYCQMEIRHAVTLKKPLVLLHGAWQCLLLLAGMLGLLV